MFKQHFLYRPSFLFPKLDSPLISSGFKSEAATPRHHCTLQLMFGCWCWSCRASSSENQQVLTDFSTAPPLPCYHGAINTHYSAGQLDFSYLVTRQFTSHLKGCTISRGQMFSNKMREVIAPNCSTEPRWAIPALSFSRGTCVSVLLFLPYLPISSSFTLPRWLAW